MIRGHIETMLEMRRIARWRESRGEMIMASHAWDCARFHENKARFLLHTIWGTWE